MTIEVSGKFLFLQFHAALVSAPLNPMVPLGFQMPLLLAEQSLRHNEIFVFVLDFFKLNIF